MADQGLTEGGGKELPGGLDGMDRDTKLLCHLSAYFLDFGFFGRGEGYPVD